jgi:hypothetical protein
MRKMADLQQTKFLRLPVVTSVRTPKCGCVYLCLQRHQHYVLPAAVHRTVPCCQSNYANMLIRPSSSVPLKLLGETSGQCDDVLENSAASLFNTILPHPPKRQQTSPQQHGAITSRLDRDQQ